MDGFGRVMNYQLQKTLLIFLSLSEAVEGLVDRREKWKEIFIWGYVCEFFFFKERIEFVLKMFYVFLSYLHRSSISRENNSDSCNVCLLWKFYKLNYTQPNMFLYVWIYLYKGKLLTLSWHLSVVSSSIGWSPHCVCTYGNASLL